MNAEEYKQAIKKPKARRRQLESSLQIACFATLRKKYPLLMGWHCPNGGKRGEIEAARFKRMGVLAGVPDVFIAHPSGKYHGFFCELKAGKNSLTDNQKVICDALLARDYYVCEARSVEEFEAHIEQYLDSCKNPSLQYWCAGCGEIVNHGAGHNCLGKNLK